MAPDEKTTGHDIVVVGASAGGVEALRSVIEASLPEAVQQLVGEPGG